MEFLDPEKKKKHNQRLFVGYFLVGVAILLSATILYFQSVGYDVDRKTGKVIQNGLIFVASQPESSTVFVNGEQKDETDSRLTVPAGNYTVELKRSGYRSWKQTFNLEGGSIERLQYARLFPEKLDQKELATYDSQPAFVTQSPDRKWILVLKPGSQTVFDVYDAGDIKKPAQSLSLPAGLLSSGDTQSFKLVEWSTDNRHVLLSHSYSGQTEFIMLDRENPSESLNLNKHLAISPTKVLLRDKKFDQIYALSADQTLQRFNTENKQATKVASNVVDFKPYAADTLLFVESDPDLANKTTVKLRDGGKDLTLRTFTDASGFLLDLAKFDGHWFIAVGAINEGRVTIYRDPAIRQKETGGATALAFSVLLMKDAQHMSFSSNARFIMVNNGNKFAIYDADTNRRYYYDEPLNIPAGQKATWMDGHRIIATSDNKVVVFDFNGTNRQTLVSIHAEPVPMFDRDYERLFTLTSAKQNAKTALTQTPLKLNLD